ncbi:MAG: hypothetical protein ABIG11_02365 [bacterium]
MKDNPNRPKNPQILFLVPSTPLPGSFFFDFLAGAGKNSALSYFSLDLPEEARLAEAALASRGVRTLSFPPSRSGRLDNSLRDILSKQRFSAVVFCGLSCALSDACRTSVAAFGMPRLCLLSDRDIRSLNTDFLREGREIQAMLELESAFSSFHAVYTESDADSPFLKTHGSTRFSAERICADIRNRLFRNVTETGRAAVIWLPGTGKAAAGLCRILRDRGTAPASVRAASLDALSALITRSAGPEVRFVCFHDFSPDEYAVRSLLAALEACPSAGAAVAPCPVFLTGPDRRAGRKLLAALSLSKKSSLAVPHFIGHVCLAAVRRKAAFLAGGLDPRFSSHAAAFTDLCLKMGLAGHSAVMPEDAAVSCGCRAAITGPEKQLLVRKWGWESLRIMEMLVSGMGAGGQASPARVKPEKP